MNVETSKEEDVWSKYRPASDNSKSLFYRHEGEGIIVYDSSARLYDEQSQPYAKLEKNPYNLKRRLEIIDAEEYGMD